MELSIATTIAACRFALDTAKSAIASHDDRVAQDAILDVKGKLASITDRALAIQESYSRLQEAHSAQSERNRELEKEILQLKTQQADLAQYERHQTARGGIVYRLNTPAQAGQTPVYICANCVAQGVKTYLQPYRSLLRCHIHGDIPSDNEPMRIDPNLLAR